jgi:MerR family transcriptional regulator, copper efflux regulator
MREGATKRLTIGQVAEGAGVGIETIRFYEREGLVPTPPRTRSGYRQYSVDMVERLRFIQRTKELGFSLRETQSSSPSEPARGRPRQTSEREQRRRSETSASESTTSRRCGRA